MGDFNAIMHHSDRAGGDTTWYRHQDDFNKCINQAELIQVPFTGLKHTWHNGQHGEKNMDWIFGNSSLFTIWPGVPTQSSSLATARITGP